MKRYILIFILLTACNNSNKKSYVEYSWYTNYYLFHLSAEKDIEYDRFGINSPTFYELNGEVEEITVTHYRTKKQFNKILKFVDQHIVFNFEVGKQIMINELYEESKTSANYHSYNDDGLIISETSYSSSDGEEDSSKTFEYNSDGYLIKEFINLSSYFGNRIRLYEYNERGLPIREEYNNLKDPDKSWVKSYEYDSNGNVKKYKRNSQFFYNNIYDEKNNLIEVISTNSEGEQTSLQQIKYDQNQNIIKTVTYGRDGEIWYQTDYRYENNKLVECNRYNSRFLYDYDKWGNLSEVVWYLEEDGKEFTSIYEYNYIYKE